MIKQKTMKFWDVEIKQKLVIVDQATEVGKSLNGAATRNFASNVC